MADTPRIDELRGRVESDPTSIAFAQLAEEHRRSGNFEEAVRICRAGLEQHPTYLSARVTLGRALLELNKYEEAQGEFEYVLRSAPDNLIALRSMAELHQRLDVDPVVDPPTDAVADPPTDPVLDNLESWLGAILDDRASRGAS